MGEELVFWLVIEVCFTVLFTFEFLLKMTALKWSYFKEAWNVFDFSLVVLAWFGIIFEYATESPSEPNTALSASEARMLRMNRIFRVMRLMRVFRLVKFLQLLRAKLSGREISLELAKHMRTITILTAFARAHVASHTQLRNYSGDANGLQGCELSRCIIDSCTVVCNAIVMAAALMGDLEKDILGRLHTLRESSKITDMLTQFVLEAEKVGVMNAREAEQLLEPLREHSAKWLMQAKEHEMGFTSTEADNRASLGSKSSQGLLSKEIAGKPLSRQIAWENDEERDCSLASMEERPSRVSAWSYTSLSPRSPAGSLLGAGVVPEPDGELVWRSIPSIDGTPTSCRI